ncbi:MAG: hypothetical protein A4S12_12910 [Proteobacteria bacterium SG_bin5]|nr:DUF2807 domain-containing protein [Sphingomonas sp.]OQW45277.1 MAG: hypothetical protein A4S12_12910 [Proteobacteria bacterium SG_bin5]
MRALILALLLPFTPATGAAAAERGFSVTSFERLRLEGPFELRVAVGGPPSARAQGDPATLERLVLQQDGTTLTVRLGTAGSSERFGAPRQPPVITLTTPVLRTATVLGGRLQVSGMRGQRLDLSVNGAGALSAEGLRADMLNVVLIGNGTLALAGQGARTALLMNGAGTIDASGLRADDLTVRLDGNGEIRAAARYTARVSSTGLGRVSVSGNPACKVAPPDNALVRCGR